MYEYGQKLIGNVLVAALLTELERRNNGVPFELVIDVAEFQKEFEAAMVYNPVTVENLGEGQKVVKLRR